LKILLVTVEQNIFDEYTHLETEHPEKHDRRADGLDDSGKSHPERLGAYKPTQSLLGVRIFKPTRRTRFMITAISLSDGEQ